MASGLPVPAWLIGAIVGATLSTVSILTQRANTNKVLVPLGKGDQDGARVAMNKAFPFVAEVSAKQILAQRERLALLAAFNDLPMLEHEIGSHRGTMTHVAQVNAVGWLGVALRTTGPQREQAVAQLDALSTTVAQNAGRLMALVKKNVRALAAAGHGLLGTPLGSDDIATLTTLGATKNATGALVSFAMAAGLAATGLAPQAEAARARARAITPAFG